MSRYILAHKLKDLFYSGETLHFTNAPTVNIRVRFEGKEQGCIANDPLTVRVDEASWVWYRKGDALSIGGQGGVLTFGVIFAVHFIIFLSNRH